MSAKTGLVQVWKNGKNPSKPRLLSVDASGARLYKDEARMRDRKVYVEMSLCTFAYGKEYFSGTNDKGTFFRMSSKSDSETEEWRGYLRALCRSFIAEFKAMHKFTIYQCGYVLLSDNRELNSERMFMTVENERVCFYKSHTDALKRGKAYKSYLLPECRMKWLPSVYEFAPANGDGKIFSANIGDEKVTDDWQVAVMDSLDAHLSTPFSFKVKVEKTKGTMTLDLVRGISIVPVGMQDSLLDVEFRFIRDMKVLTDRFQLTYKLDEAVGSERKIIEVKTESGDSAIVQALVWNMGVVLDGRWTAYTQSLTEYSWFCLTMPRGEAEGRLNRTPPGTFLIRTSESSKYNLSLTVRKSSGFTHCLINNKWSSFVALKRSFDSVPAIVEYYSRNGGVASDEPNLLLRTSNGPLAAASRPASSMSNISGAPPEIAFDALEALMDEEFGTSSRRASVSSVSPSSRRFSNASANSPMASPMPSRSDPLSQSQPTPTSDNHSALRGLHRAASLTVPGAPATPTHNSHTRKLSVGSSDSPTSTPGGFAPSRRAQQVLHQNSARDASSIPENAEEAAMAAAIAASLVTVQHDRNGHERKRSVSHDPSAARSPKPDRPPRPDLIAPASGGNLAAAAAAALLASGTATPPKGYSTAGPMIVAYENIDGEEDEEENGQSFLTQIRREQIRLGPELGQGEFGCVRKALYKVNGVEGEVAVKMIKAKGAGMDEFRNECVLQGSLRHRAIVRAIGLCEMPDELMFVTELMPLGSLKGYLEGNVNSIPPDTLRSYAAQVADAMAYVERKKLVHRDLAARNVLMASHSMVKVSDFGLARETDDDDVYQSARKRKMPLRWMPPEALYFNRFDIKSDVWGFGVLVWEMFTFGDMPWNEYTKDEMIRQIDSGRRLACPPNCPAVLYDIMNMCWLQDPSNRPEFWRLYELLNDLRI
eukprot:Opistho-2@21126